MNELTPEEKILRKKARQEAFHRTAFYKVVSWPAVKTKALYAKLSEGSYQVDLSEKQDGSHLVTVPRKKPLWLYAGLIFAVILLVACFLPLHYSYIQFTWEWFWHEIVGLFTPIKGFTNDTAGWWGYGWKMFSTEFFHLFIWCFLGTTLGALLSIPVYYLCAQNVTKNAFIRTPVRIFNDLLRTIPMFIMGYMVSLIFSVGNSIDAVLTIAIFTLGIMYQMMFEYIETLEMLPFEAIRSAGGTNLQCTHIGLAPEVRPMFFAYFIYTLEINIRASVILSYVGFKGYVYDLQNNITQGFYDYVGAMLWPLLVVVALLQFLSNSLARRLR